MSATTKPPPPIPGQRADTEEWGAVFDTCERLVMFQQLALRYGGTFWPTAHSRARAARPRGADRWASTAGRS
ncbi:hypothetical protein [Kitasatospora purpeofusca]|uniref:hypothetical protein n=1 Tax=Kitasatospora purpeofusca TaxID=67352 RepID=UPI0035DA5FCC